MAPTQNYFGPIPGLAVFWAIFILSLVLFFLRTIKLIRYLNLGRKINRTDSAGLRILAAIYQIILQRCSLRSFSKKDFSGIGHAVIFWGFGVFFLNYILFIFIGGGLGLSEFVDGLVIAPWVKLLTDWAAILIIAMLVWAAFRRYILKPERLVDGKGSVIILGWIFLLMVVYFIHRSSQILWWLHYILIMGFVVYLPYSKHLHILTAPLNLFFAPDRRVGSFDTGDGAFDFPGQDIGFLHWKHLFDLYCCTECGRCQASCPATKAGTPLKPKDMLLKLKRFIIKHGDDLLRIPIYPEGNTFRSNHDHNLVGSVIGEAELWACTTCGRCQEECPVLIEHVDRIVNLRRCFIENGHASGSLANFLESLLLLGNPWARSPAERINWVSDQNIQYARENERVDVLYWIGCTGAYDPSGQEIAQAMVEVLKASGMHFAILGGGEKCCGEPARRVGEEGLFQKLAYHNILELSKYKFDKIMTHCPHCYNVIKHEYPEFGGQFEVVHHTELLADLNSEGIFIFKEFGKRVTYHDPCYLGRYNRQYSHARSLIRAIPEAELVEMADNKNSAVCCGGGGGLFWLDWPSGDRINYQRFSQVQEALPQILITACPFCKILLDDASHFSKLENQVQIQDIVELVRSCILHQG